MKKKISFLIALSMLLTGCNTAENTEQTTEKTTTTTAETTVTTTTTKVTTTMAETTAPAEEISISGILLSPVENIGMNTAMPIESEEINGIESEESFPEKEHIRLVKEYAWESESVQNQLNSFNWERSEQDFGILAPACAEELVFNSGLYEDFDNDGINESIIGLNISCDSVIGCLKLFYCDENGVEKLDFQSNINPVYTKIINNDYEFWMITALAGIGNSTAKLYSFPDGSPIEVFSGGDGGRVIYCYDNFLLECPKYPWNSFPAVITSDGEIKRLSVELISKQSFNTHVNNGEELISALKGNDFTVNKIYTAGFFSFWLESDDGECCYFDFYDLIDRGELDTVKLDNSIYGVLPEINAENTISGIDLFGKVPDMSAIEYLTQIEKCEGFSDTLDMGADAVIADLDDDGSPELIIQICSMVTISDVFGIDENGAYRATVSKDSIITENAGDVSYVGEPPVGCIIDREPQYFARYWSGGSCGGEGGWARVILSDREIKTEPLVQYEMYKDGFAQVYEYSGFESEEEYNKYIEDFFSRHRSAPVVKFRLLDVEKSEYRALVLQQLEKYFTKYKSETSFASYLTAYTEKHEDPPHGVLIEDINGDGQDEMIIHTNPFGNLNILYMKDRELKTIECGVMSQWGGTWYDKVNNRIVNEYFYNNGSDNYAGNHYNNSACHRTDNSNSRIVSWADEFR